MSRKSRFAAFGVLLVAALAAFITPSAQAVPVITVGYSARAIDSPLADACTMATAMVDAHCRIHGTITTATTRCWNVLSEDGTHLELACECEASTRLCMTNPR